MHTQVHNKVIFHHNDDYSGIVIIVYDGEEIRLPYEAIKSLVANQIRSEKISNLEQMDDDQLFGIKTEPIFLGPIG